MSDLINRENILCLSYCVEPATIDNICGSEPVINVSDIENAPSVNAIVLPCKVGDNLYRQDGIWECTGFDCDQSGTWRVKLRKDYYYHTTTSSNYLYTRMVFGAFGKTVFTSKEEYERVFPPKTITLTKEQQQRKEFFEKQHRQHECWIIK